MENIVLNAVNNAASTSQSYDQFVQTIQTYCSWIVGQSIITDSNVNSVLTGCKTNATQWFNTIYPTYLNMPATIAGTDTTVRSDLTLLVQLAGQLQSNNTPAIQASINQYASSLQQTVSGIRQQTTNLSTALQTFQNNLTGDQQTLTNSTGAMQQKIVAGQTYLSQLVGRLHQLQNASCPNNSDISNCQNDIRNQQNQLNNLATDHGVLYTAAQYAYNAVSALAYLTTYWQMISKDAQASGITLSRLQSDPSTVLQLDLTTSLNQWNALMQQYQQLS